VVNSQNQLFPELKGRIKVSFNASMPDITSIQLSNGFCIRDGWIPRPGLPYPPEYPSPCPFVDSPLLLIDSFPAGLFQLDFLLLLLRDQFREVEMRSKLFRLKNLVAPINLDIRFVPTRLVGELKSSHHGECSKYCGSRHYKKYPVDD